VAREVCHHLTISQPSHSLTFWVHPLSHNLQLARRISHHLSPWIPLFLSDFRGNSHLFAAVSERSESISHVSLICTLPAPPIGLCELCCWPRPVRPAASPPCPGAPGCSPLPPTSCCSRESSLLQALYPHGTSLRGGKAGGACHGRVTGSGVLARLQPVAVAVTATVQASVTAAFTVIAQPACTRDLQGECPGDAQELKGSEGSTLSMSFGISRLPRGRLPCLPRGSPSCPGPRQSQCSLLNVSVPVLNPLSVQSQDGLAPGSLAVRVQSSQRLCFRFKPAGHAVTGRASRKQCLPATSGQQPSRAQEASGSSSNAARSEWPCEALIK